MTHTVKWLLRPQPEADGFPAEPEREVELVLNDLEWEWFSAVRGRVVGMDPCRTRTGLLNEIHVLAELKVFVPGEVVASAAVL